MIPHLNGRAEALSALGWTGRDAEWLALVCLHSGVFLRRQYLAFVGRTNPVFAHRFVQRCGKAAVEQPWDRFRLCRIACRPLYRALGAEDVRHRRAASAAVLLRRLLSLDYVLDHLDQPWLPTEQEKVSALTAAGVPAETLPGRVYVGRESRQRRLFVHKLPVAVDRERATFVLAQAEDATEAAVRDWGEAHAEMWAALAVAGRAIDVVVVGRDPVRLRRADRVLAAWTRNPRSGGDEARTLGGQREVRAEIESIRRALAALDHSALETYGGLNGAAARCAELEKEAAGFGRAKPAITAGRTWRSRRVPE